MVVRGVDDIFHSLPISFSPFFFLFHPRKYPGFIVCSFLNEHGVEMPSNRKTSIQFMEESIRVAEHLQSQYRLKKVSFLPPSLPPFLPSSLPPFLPSSLPPFLPSSLPLFLSSSLFPFFPPFSFFFPRPLFLTFRPLPSPLRVTVLFYAFFPVSIFWWPPLLVFFLGLFPPLLLPLLIFLVIFLLLLIW